LGRRKGFYGGCIAATMEWKSFLLALQQKDWKDSVHAAHTVALIFFQKIHYSITPVAFIFFRKIRYSITPVAFIFFQKIHYSITPVALIFFQKIRNIRTRIPFLHCQHASNG